MSLTELQQRALLGLGNATKRQTARDLRVPPSVLGRLQKMRLVTFIWIDEVRYYCLTDAGRQAVDSAQQEAITCRH
jgi:hypothetical protein